MISRNVEVGVVGAVGVDVSSGLCASVLPALLMYV